MNVISLVLINIFEKKILWCICIPVDNGKSVYWILMSFSLFGYL